MLCMVPQVMLIDNTETTLSSVDKVDEYHKSCYSDIINLWSHIIRMLFTPKLSIFHHLIVDKFVTSSLKDSREKHGDYQRLVK